MAGQVPGVHFRSFRQLGVNFQRFQPFAGAIGVDHFLGGIWIEEAGLAIIAIFKSVFGSFAVFSRAGPCR